MAVNRQANFLGQQRVDIPHLRALESGTCYDFDAVGLLMTGGAACVISGFEVVNYATVVGANATAIVLKTADSRIVHPLASDSGSFFQVPSDRANETLDTNNIRILGSWTPSAVNYVGVDLLRTADNTTADTVRFLDTSADSESDERVPLARTMDYVITISTSPFSVSPTICPVLKVTLNASSAITAIQDARNLLFRLGSGGDAPKTNNPFGWPGGRNEGSTATAYVAGDRSIKSLKNWVDSIMTRLQEVGGGEYWYSLTSDRNVRLAQGSSLFVSSGEAFEWVSSNLHWKGLKVIFDNSTGYINEIADQVSDNPGQTDLADGECIYVDLDRSSNKTSSNALVAQKAALTSLGGSTVPGQRWVVAYRIGAYIYIRDQSFPVGSSWRLATTAAVGFVKTTINANGDDSGNPIAIGLADSATAYYTATCGGISHNTDVGTGHILTQDDLIIGRGSLAGDDSVFIQTDTEGRHTHIYGRNNWSVGNKAAVKITQGYLGRTNVRIVDFAYTPGGVSMALPSTGTDNSLNAVSINCDASIAVANADTNPTTPASVAKDRAQIKMFARSNKVLLSPVDALFGLQVANANAIFTGWTWNPIGYWTKNDTTALGTTWTGGVTVDVNSRVLACWPLNNSLTEPDYATNEVFAPYYRIYRITNMGGSGQYAVLVVDDDILEGSVVYNNADSGDFNNMYFRLYTKAPITEGTTALIWAPCNQETVDMYCFMDGTGAITPVYQSIPHLGVY